MIVKVTRTLSVKVYPAEDDTTHTSPRPSPHKRLKKEKSQFKQHYAANLLGIYSDSDNEKFSTGDEDSAFFPPSQQVVQGKDEVTAKFQVDLN